MKLHTLALCAAILLPMIGVGNGALAAPPPITESQQAIQDMMARTVVVEIPSLTQIKTKALGPVYKKGLSLGSGFLIDNKGHVVTNYHVIAEGAAKPRVIFKDRNGISYEFPAMVVGFSKEDDIAVLAIDTMIPEMKVASWGDSDNAHEGDPVVAIGAPFGLDYTVSKGVISAMNRMGTSSYYGSIQHDAAINHGNSGGPLFDASGHVIGINTELLDPRSDSGDNPNGGVNVGISLAIPSDHAKMIVDRILAKQDTRKAVMGIALASNIMMKTSPDGLPYGMSKYAKISEIVPGKGGDKAGLKVGDIIVSVNGKEIESVPDFVWFVTNMIPGTKIDVMFVRDQKLMHVQVTLDAHVDDPTDVSTDSGSDGSGDQNP